MFSSLTRIYWCARDKIRRGLMFWIASMRSSLLRGLTENNFFMEIVRPNCFLKWNTLLPPDLISFLKLSTMSVTGRPSNNENMIYLLTEAAELTLMRLMLWGKCTNYSIGKTTHKHITSAFLEWLVLIGYCDCIISKFDTELNYRQSLLLIVIQLTIHYRTYTFLAYV